MVEPLPAGGSVRPASNGGGPEPAAPDRPEPEFEITGVRSLERAATPTLSLSGAVSDRSGRRVLMIALTALITVEPGERSYGDDDRGRLIELFGEPERWASTTGSFRWTQADVVVPSFRGEGGFEIPIHCTYDHEVAATKYFAGVEDGDYPLRLHLSGTVYYEGDDGRMQMLRLPWDRSTRFGLPVETWRRTIEAHYPRGGWVHLSDETLAALASHRARTGTATSEAAIRALLEAAEGEGAS
jgi:hypothetical protein